MKERLNEVTAFAEGWKDKPRARVVEEIASYLVETQKEIDPYTLLLGDDGEIYDPITGEPVEKSIEKDSYLGSLESQAFDKIKLWNVGKEKGLVFWISPPHPERSTFTKIIVSEITKEENSRGLFNRSILLNINKNEVVDLAKDLSLQNGKILTINSPEELRSQPVFIDDVELDWIDYLGVRTNEKGILQKIITGEDLKIKEKEVQTAQIMYEQIFGHDTRTFGFDDERVKEAVKKAADRGSFGSFGPSCPPARSRRTAFGAFSESSSEAFFNCPKCGQKIPAGRGITECPNTLPNGKKCEAKKEDYPVCV